MSAGDETDERDAPPQGTLAPLRIVVDKFGGTSVGDLADIRAVASRLAAARQAGQFVVAVVSAMGSTTDRLVALASSVGWFGPSREMDMLLSSGECISASLVALATRSLGVPAVALTGAQAGILSDDRFGAARVLDVDAGRIRRILESGAVPVVAGFQGGTAAGDMTTLGRGGSDTTAVLLAASLGAERCDIHKDVDGVFTADPRLVPSARLLRYVSFEDMRALAGSGACVLQYRAVETAMQAGVELHIRSSRHDGAGTKVGPLRQTAEHGGLTAVTHRHAATLLTLRRGDAARLSALRSAMADHHVPLEFLTQGCAESRVLVPAETLDLTVALAGEHGLSTSADLSVGTVTLVGRSLVERGEPLVMVRAALAAVGVSVYGVVPSERSMTLIVAPRDVNPTVTAAHEAVVPALAVAGPR